MRTKDRSLDAVSTETLAVHAGREDFAALGVHAPPLDLSTTYPLGDLDAATHSFDRLAAGDASAPNPVYARLYNPTVGRFEEALAALEGTEEAVAFGSGMAAVTAVLLARTRAGRHVVALRPLYGGSDHLLSSGLLGLEVTWATADTVAAAIRPDTCLVVIETPGNPTVTLVDIAAVVAQAGAVPVLVDSTFASPVLQRPADQGAAYVLHSATKVLGGHGDVIAGVVATSEARARELREVRILTGGLLHPLGAYLLHRGLPTLPLRVERAQASARDLARRLAEHPAVTHVCYPGLPGGDPRGLIGRQMSGPGSNLAFEVAGGHEGARQFLAALELITPAVSLGSTDTLIQHPAGLTHRLMDPATREELGITDGLLRLSVGLESPDDLWRDLERGLSAAAASAWSTTAVEA
jgi:cystathionine beta-lyase/cystathionine gamma-synthase